MFGTVPTVFFHYCADRSQARSAWDLKKAWGEGLRLEIVDDAGHSAHEPGITRLLVEATNEMAKKLDW